MDMYQVDRAICACGRQTLNARHAYYCAVKYDAAVGCVAIAVVARLFTHLTVEGTVRASSCQAQCAMARCVTVCVMGNIVMCSMCLWCLRA